MAKLSLAFGEWLRLRTRAEPTTLGRMPAVREALSCDSLFTASVEPVLIVDAATDSIVEGNPAAATAFGTSRDALIGAGFLEAFDSGSVEAVRGSLATARLAGRATVVGVRASGGAELCIKLSLFHHLGDAYLLAHPSAGTEGKIGPAAGARASSPASSVIQAIDDASVGFLLTDSRFRVEYANHAFLQMIGLDSLDDVRGAPVTKWLRLSEMHLACLQRQSADRQAVGELTTTLRTEQDCPRGVEVSAVAAPDGHVTWWGFCIRELSRVH